MQIRTSPAGSSLLAFAAGISKPEILNTDPGVRLTCLDFTGRLEQEEIRIRMDGRGRVFDSIFVERLWRREFMKLWIIEPLMNFMSEIG